MSLVDGELYKFYSELTTSSIITAKVRNGSACTQHYLSLSDKSGKLKTFVSVFSVFSFLNRFPLQLFLVPYSYLLLFSPSMVCFFGESASLSSFFNSFFCSVFCFHKLLVLMR